MLPFRAEVKAEAPLSVSNVMRLLHSALLASCILPLHAEIKVAQDGTNLKIEIDGALFTEYRSDTKEGSVAIRVAPTLRLKGEVAKSHITNSEGVTDDAAWGKRAKWVAFHGPDSAETPTVIAILDHTKNLRHPTWWHARDYGLLTANPFGARSYRDKEFKGSGDFTLKNGASLKQRYRLVLHQGDLASAKLEEQWRAFTQ